MCSLPTPAFHLLVYFSWSPQGAAQSAPFEDGKTSTCSRPGQGKLGGGGGRRREAEEAVAVSGALVSTILALSPLGSATRFSDSGSPSVEAGW